MGSDRSLILMLLVTPALLLTIFIGCQNAVDSVSAEQASSEAKAKVLIFDSGRGTGQYDEMTYAEYKSELALTPLEDMRVSGIQPQIYYCNGTSGFVAFIRSEHFGLIAAEAGLVDGTGPLVPDFSNRSLDSSVTLKAGTTYIIVMSVWTTRSVGIYTTGVRTEGTVGSARYVVRYGKSDTVDHLDRGGIAFQLTF